MLEFQTDIQIWVNLEGNLSNQHLTIYLLLALERKVLSWRIIENAGKSRFGGGYIKMKKSIAKGLKSFCSKENLNFAMSEYDSRALDDMQEVTSHFCLNITQTLMHSLCGKIGKSSYLSPKLINKYAT